MHVLSTKHNHLKLLASVAMPVDYLLNKQLTRFKNFVEKGKPD